MEKINTLEISIRKKEKNVWDVETNLTKVNDSSRVNNKGKLTLSEKDIDSTLTNYKTNPNPEKYGRFLGKALFQDEISDAYKQAIDSSPEGMRVILTVEDQELEALYWHWLCAPRDWNFISLNQRSYFSIGLESSVNRNFPQIKRQNLKALN